MPAILVALAALLLRLVEPIVGRVLVALGIMFITIEGMDIVLSEWSAHITAGMGAMGEVAAILTLLRVGDAINIVVSATIAAYSIKAMTGGLRKMVLG